MEYHIVDMTTSEASGTSSSLSESGVVVASSWKRFWGYAMVSILDLERFWSCCGAEPKLLGNYSLQEWFHSDSGVVLERFRSGSAMCQWIKALFSNALEHGLHLMIFWKYWNMKTVERDMFLVLKEGKEENGKREKEIINWVELPSWSIAEGLCLKKMSREMGRGHEIWNCADVKSISSVLSSS